MSLKQELEQIISGAPHSIRGPWRHYPCIKCYDTRGHGAKMGYNETTGRIRCLRCGFSFNLGASGPRLQHSRARDASTEVLRNAFSMHREVGGPDDGVRDYMHQRGITENVGWGYGRGKLLGLPVFPAFDVYGGVRYLQWKIPGQKGYRSFKGEVARPHMDCCPSLKLDRSRLVLVEGPLDSARIRQDLKVWSAPIYGQFVSNQFMRTIVGAVEHYGTETITVILDRETQASATAMTLRNKLAFRVPGAMVRFANWKQLDGEDPDSMRLSELVEEVYR